jgi:lipopolysaccharide cholinephosphotransferase
MEDLSLYNPEGSDLRRMQMRMVEILNAFDVICRKHDINYWLACGTLLGARRHGGFIPWDDDLDVYILQTDYKKLISILKEELPANLKVQTRETDENYWFFYAKIRDVNSRYYDKNTGVDNLKYEGIFIDVFPIEPVPSMGFKKFVDKFILSDNRLKKAESLYEKVKYTIKTSFIPFVQLLVTLSRFYYRHLGSKKIYAYAFGVFFYTKYNIDNLFPSSEIVFEGKKYRAPGNVDKHLIENFDSNFMVIPNPEKRRTHSLKIDFFCLL